MSNTVEYSMNIYLKSGKVLASDPVEMQGSLAEKKIIEVWDGVPDMVSLSLTRNGRFVIIPKESIDYIEFHVDVPDASS